MEGVLGDWVGVVFIEGFEDEGIGEIVKNGDMGK